MKTTNGKKKKRVSKAWKRELIYWLKVAYRVASVVELFI